ncbi:MAG TPA: hypothetical protein VHU79_10905, partial [Sphingomicrobium sp.]|nr:hypothetical protein [Sphingomicrobium sp.]
FDIASDHTINGYLVRSDFVSLQLSIPQKPLISLVLTFQLSVPLHACLRRVERFAVTIVASIALNARARSEDATAANPIFCMTSMPSRENQPTLIGRQCALS